MKPPRLSKRLAAACDLVGYATCLVDVGCDHGKLCVYCLVSGAALRAIAVDISAPSLAKAEALAASYDLPLDVRLGDGLQPLAAGEADTAVIAGMGGMEIARILALAPYAPRRLVLVPHKNADTVARYLHLAGYRTERDFVLLDEGHWYRVMLATAEHADVLGADWRVQADALDPSENWYVGIENAANPEYAAYRDGRLDKLRSYVAEGNTDPRIRAEIKYLETIEYSETI